MDQRAEYAGIRGTNFFTTDAPLNAWLKARKAPKDALDRLTKFGALCGGRLDELVEAAQRDENLPELVRYDRWGTRIDEIRYCPEQVEARKLVLGAGVLPPLPLWERLVKAYLVNQVGEGGVTCPLAMTDGLAWLLRDYGTADQRERWLPLVESLDTPTPLTGGQFVTERQGGSVVSENETRAVPQKDGSWRLTGLKWFCSNPGELWVTTAKPEGSSVVGLFLVPRRLSDGTLNEAHILRIKDLVGTRGKATAEVEYKGAWAELIGRPSHGLAMLMNVVIATSRRHVTAGSLGMMRRAHLEAQAYARSRKIMGRPASEIPEVRLSLSRVEALWRGAQSAFFEMIRALEEEAPEAEVLVPLLKIGVSKAASEAVREAQMVFAGNGILRDFSILPRLSQDTLIQEIWEGTHAVLAGHVEKALRRKDSRRAFESMLGGARLPELEGLALCEAAYASLTRALASSGRSAAKVL